MVIFEGGEQLLAVILVRFITHLKSLQLSSDGPYLFINERTETISIENIVPGNFPHIVKEEIPSASVLDHVFTVNIDDHAGKAAIHSFSFKLHSTANSGSNICTFPLPAKVLVTTDIEGNFHALVSLLLENAVINKDADWVFGNNHLVINGDLIDRDRNVLPCLWLIYELEAQAREAGGAVHYLLGNHELMNFKGDYRYVHPKYISSQTDLERYRLLFGSSSVLANWIRSKNTIERIGHFLFVHGGLSKKLMKYRLSMEEMNKAVQLSLNNQSYDIYNELQGLLCGNYGPLWYRGMVLPESGTDAITETDIDNILDYFHATRIIVGHTMVPSFRKLFNGKLIAIDILLAGMGFLNPVHGLLLEDGKEYITINGHKKKF